MLSQNNATNCTKLARTRTSTHIYGEWRIVRKKEQNYIHKHRKNFRNFQKVVQSASGLKYLPPPVPRRLPTTWRAPPHLAIHRQRKASCKKHNAATALIFVYLSALSRLAWLRAICPRIHETNKRATLAKKKKNKSRKNILLSRNITTSFC